MGERQPGSPPEIRGAMNSEANQDGRQSNMDLLQRQLPRLDSQDQDSRHWADRIWEEVWRDYGHRRREEPSYTIFWVPDNIRKADPKAYEPTVISIGPLSRDFPGRSRAMEEAKWRCVRWLLLRAMGRNGADRLLHECITRMASLQNPARACWSKEIDIDPQYFPTMLLLDGCFILHLLLKQMEQKAEDVEVLVIKVGDEEGPSWESGLWISSLVKYDLLKLENQIPFFIVQELFDVLRIPDDAGVDLVELALKLFRTLDRQKINIARVHHLLHLYHLSLLPPSMDGTFVKCDGSTPSPSPQWIISATELEETGVKFKRKTHAGSTLEVTFADGVMEIPPLRVSDYSNTLLRNLMAFEQCFPVASYITDYALFMDCIMRTARDAKLLQLRGIVMNGLGDDEEVARFFGRLCNQVQYHSYGVSYLRELYTQVGKYQESQWHKWQAVLKRDYCGNPWLVVSVVAAAVLLLATLGQGLFAALAYFRPPK